MQAQDCLAATGTMMCPSLSDGSTPTQCFMVIGEGTYYNAGDGTVKFESWQGKMVLNQTTGERVYHPTFTGIAAGIAYEVRTSDGRTARATDTPTVSYSQYVDLDGKTAGIQTTITDVPNGWTITYNPSQGPLDSGNVTLTVTNAAAFNTFVTARQGALSEWVVSDYGPSVGGNERVGGDTNISCARRDIRQC